MKDYYQLKKDDDKAFEIYDTRDKSSFLISKKDLHPARQIQVMKLKKYAEGGEVESSKNFGEFFENVKAKKAAETAAEPFFFEANLPKRYERPMGVPYMPQPVASEFLTPTPVDLPTTQGPMVASNEIGPGAYGMANVPQEPAQPTQAMPMPQQHMPDGYGQQIAGLRGLADVQGKVARAEEKSLANQESMMNELMAKRQERQARFEQRDNELGARLEKESNLQGYWGNLSAGGKISTAIGLLLGGIGAGLTGKENLAINVINENINKAVELNKELYRRNKEEYKDDELAAAQTKSDLLTLAGIEAKRTAAQFGTQQAQANFQVLAGQLAQQQAQLRQQMDQRGMERDMRAMAARGMTPEQAAMLPPEIRKTMAKLPDGRMVDVGTEKKAQKIEDVSYRQAALKNNIESLKRLVEKKGTFELFGAEEDQMNAIINEIATDSAKIIDPDSIAREGEVKLFRQQLFEPGTLMKSNETVKKTLENYEQMINNRALEQFKAMGVPGASAQQATLPGDIQYMNGIPYRRIGDEMVRVK